MGAPAVMLRLLTILLLIVSVACAPEHEVDGDDRELYAHCPDNAVLMMGQSNAVRFDRACDVAVYAMGATVIAEWLPGGALYEGALQCAGTSLETVIWFQGESDAMPRYNANGYAENLETLLMALEEDLGVRMILVHTITGYSADQIIHDAKEATGEQTIETFDLERGDGIHLTLEAQIELCERMGG